MAVAFSEAVRAWIHIAAHSFGGPAGQIDVAHRVLVEEKGWLTEERFRHALGFCMMLPGPEAMQLVTYAGWLTHGVLGGIVAGGLFILPGFLAILGIGLAYITWADASVLVALFWGLKAAVLAIVARAAYRLARRTSHTASHVIIAAWAFVALFLFDVPFPIVIIATGVAGWLARRPGPGHPSTEAPVPRRATAKTVLIWGGLWLGPVALLWLLMPDAIYTRLATFFATAATLTFGGAYAVLAYVAQRAVEDYGWLTAGEMLDGLALAETTPGPLIQVVQFVGMLAVDGAWAAVLAAVIVTWVTFMPSFLWIFAGAPYMQRVREDGRVRAVLDGVAAGVVGVIANLAAWMALRVLWQDVHVTEGILHLSMPSSPDPWAFMVAGVALLALRVHLFAALGVGAAAGLLLGA